MKKQMSPFAGICVLCLVFLCACTAVQSEDSGPTWQEQYDLGVRYLSEGNYQEAIIAFTAAIEIDPKHVETYLKLSDAYVAMEETEKAVQVLYEAIQVCGDDPQLISTLESLGFIVGADGTLQELTLNAILQGAKRAVDSLYYPGGYESYLTYSELHNMLDPIKENLELYIIRKPDDPQGYLYLGGIYCILNEMDLCLATRQEGFLKTGDALLVPSNHSRAYEESSVDCDAWGRITRWVDGLGVPRTCRYGNGAQLAQLIVEYPSERHTLEYFYEDGRRVSMANSRIGQAGGQTFEWNRIYTYEYPGNNTCVRRYWMVEQEEAGSDFDIVTFDSYGNTTLSESYDSISGELRYSVEW